MKKKSQPQRLTIDELEQLLEHDEDVAIRILPNGEIVREDGGDGGKNAVKSLTMREQLDGEYAFA